MPALKKSGKRNIAVVVANPVRDSNCVGTVSSKTLASVSRHHKDVWLRVADTSTGALGDNISMNDYNWSPDGARLAAERRAGAMTSAIPFPR